MLRWLFAGCFLLMTFSSCTYLAEKRNLAVYHELVGTNDTVNKMTKQWYQMVIVATKTKNFATLDPYRLQMAAYLNKKREIIANLKVGAEAVAIVDSEQTYLSAQALAVSDIYFTVESFNYLTPIEDIQDEMKVISDNINLQAQMYDAMKKSLHAFARRNSLKVLNVTL